MMDDTTGSPVEPAARCELTELLKSECAHCRAPAPSPAGMREQVYDLIVTKPGRTADEIADHLGISVATVHAHVGSLRAGRDVNDGPGRPSSGPVEPVFIACEYDRDLQRYEYRVPVESYGGVAYALRRQRTIVKQLRKLAGMLDVWFDKYPRDVVVRIAHRGVHRLVEDLDDAIARQEQEVS